MPPSLMVGHEMFSSMAATPSASDRMRETSAYSSSVVPQTFTMTVAWRARSSGSFSSTKRRTPMPCKPMAFSQKQPFDCDAAECRQVHEVVVFDAVAKAAAGRDDRILERQRANADGQ